jgi:hypothetical protein
MIRGERGGSMNGHYLPGGGKSVEWYTPPMVFDRLGLEFDLDPCSPLGGLPWIPARRFLSIEDDGLAQPWNGRVWLNPPYGPHVVAWMRRLADHGNGLALIFARTDTAWWHEIAPTADALCLVEGRLWFVNHTGERQRANAGGPSALLAWGEENGDALARSGLGMTFRVASIEGAQGALW